MSVYIPGMEMPNNCRECPLETDYGTCGYYSLFVEAEHESSWETRREDCPLVPVPEHGRLIDAEALKAEGWELQMYKHDEYGCSIICRNLDSDDIPTIIPAEEGE